MIPRRVGKDLPCDVGEAGATRHYAGQVVDGKLRILAYRMAMLGCVKGLYMAFARWDPIRDLLAIQHRLDRFAPGPAGWVPPIDVHETADAYVVTAELPGLSKDDVEIHISDGRVHLSGVRPDRGVSCEQYHRVERGRGSFSRTFELPLPVDGEATTADLRDGVLTVTCPKAAEGSARRIRVS
jgi:HSP20 family protein